MGNLVACPETLQVREVGVMTTPRLGRILIVDDEVELMTALCETLAEQGYEVVGKSSPGEALAFLQAEDVDLLLCDLMMPEMDGIALLRAALDVDPCLVGIIMTGQGTIQTAVDAMKVGAFDYVLKPFRLHVLLPVLARALGIRQLRMENMQLRETVAIYELGQAIAYTLDVNTILHKTVDVAMQQVGGEEAAVMLPAPDGEALFVAAVRGQGREALLGTRVSMAQSITGWVAQHREPLTLHGAVSDPRFASQHRRDDITAMALPMLAGGKLVGVLSVNAMRRHRAFTLGQVKALTILANLAATALENASLYTEVRQSEERFRSVTESAADAIISVDSNGKMLSWNRGAQSLFGYSYDEVMGQLLTQLLPERYREACTRGLRRAVATGQQRLRGKTVEVYALTRDGREVPVELSLSHWQTHQGLFFSAIIRDIGERKQAEEALRQAQKMQAMGTLAGGIAHDFNNILTAILGYTELAMQDVQRDSVVWNNLQSAFIAGHRAKDLVQQILAFSRQTAVERTPVQLHLLIKEALTLLRAALPATIALQQVVDPEAGTVLADPTQMHQVLINLCTNAAHAMRDTGGTIEVHLEPIDVTTDSPAPAQGLTPGPYVRLTVSDTGHGMTPEIMQRIFEPFFTTKSRGEGTGMGLAIVHGIVTGHGGAITVESTPGQGTTFAVYLPCSDRSSTAAVPTEEPVAGGAERILFIDDEEALVQLGKAILERLGYHVVVCTDSLAALDTFRTAPQSFDLVITDSTMPKMTGEALVRALRHIRPDIPIILCTGYSRVMTAEQSQMLGIDALVLKPMMAGDWGRVIRQVLGQRAALRA
jgi:PAS domain S-box-containing protein